MYLSRIKLNLEKDAAKRALSSPQVLHGAIENCFIEKNRTLWRLDSLNGSVYLLLVSQIVPDFEKFIDQFCDPSELGQIKNYGEFLANIKNGQQLRFRIKGNPVHSVIVTKGSRGKVTPHISDFHKKVWLTNKSIQNGFLLNESHFEIVETGLHQFYTKSKTSPIRLSYATFEGILTVEDVDLFVKALTNGIGRAKAYGCGLMTVMVQRND